MKIGIAAPVDIISFERYFQNEEDLVVLRSNSLHHVASAVHTLVHSLIKKQHHVTLYVLSQNNFILKSEIIDIIGIERYKTYPIKHLWGDFLNAKRIEKVIEKSVNNLDILHAHWTYAYALAATKFTSTLPVFCTVRDWAPIIWKFESRKNKITWFFRMIMSKQVLSAKGLHLIANSPYTQQLIKKHYNIETPIIPNPISSDFLKKETLQKENVFEIICVSSSLDKRKNIETLLISFSNVIKVCPSAHLALVGPPFTKINRKVEEWRKKNLLQNVTLFGKINHNDLNEFYDKASLFVTPSLEETFGNTILEAMARKTAVLGGLHSGAVPYVLNHGEFGFLCDVSNHLELSSAILHIFSDLEETKIKTDKAFKFLMQEYVDEVISEKHITMYIKKLNDYNKTV